jgi:glyoxylase-like metal-dependent hydrolase (beta-lactamase superfamily II)
VRARQSDAQRTTLIRDVAEGVHLVTRAHTNMYLVETGGRLLLVDAGLPAFWQGITGAIAELGYSRDSVTGLLLTHGHFDHVGCARRLHSDWGIDVWVAERDRALAAHPYSYRHERNRPAYVLRHPRGLPAIMAMSRAGALSVKGVDEVIPIPPAPPLPPGIELVSTPGHTDGHTAVHLVHRDALITGDALVTFDPYTGRSGPQIVAGAATADSGLALESLADLQATEAGIVLPGHGGPWEEGIGEAVTLASRRGAH